MKPLKFKVKKLYDKCKVGHCAEGFPNKLLAYQLTPEYHDFYVDEKLISHYGGITNAMFYGDGRLWQLRVNLSNTTQPFLIPAELYKQFKQAVHEYNLKYCEVPDVKVLDGFYKWNLTKNLQHDDHNGIDTNKLNNRIEMYKDTLVSPEMWFEESE